MAEPTSGIEASNPTLGSIKIFGVDPNMLFTLLTFVLSSLTAWTLWTHTEEARAGSKEAAQVIKESNKELAQVLREQTRATREQNCLAQFDNAKDKARNAELCKRISQ